MDQLTLTEATAQAVDFNKYPIRFRFVYADPIPHFDHPFGSGLMRWSLDDIARRYGVLIQSPDLSGCLAVED